MNMSEGIEQQVAQGGGEKANVLESLNQKKQNLHNSEVFFGKKVFPLWIEKRKREEGKSKGCCVVGRTGRGRGLSAADDREGPSNKTIRVKIVLRRP